VACLAWALAAAAGLAAAAWLAVVAWLAAAWFAAAAAKLGAVGRRAAQLLDAAQPTAEWVVQPFFVVPAAAGYLPPVLVVDNCTRLDRSAAWSAA